MHETEKLAKASANIFSVKSYNNNKIINSLIIKSLIKEMHFRIA